MMEDYVRRGSKTISQEVRGGIVNLCNGGKLSQDDIAKTFNVSSKSVRNIMATFNATGDTLVASRGGLKRKM